MRRARRLVLGIVLGALGSALSPVQAVAAAPVVESESVSHVTPVDATLEAQINPGGLETSYRFHLAYGCDLAGNEVCPMYCISGEPCPGPVNGPVNIPLPGGILPTSSETKDVSLDLDTVGVKLMPGTKYRYSVEANNKAGAAQGQNQFFTTPSAAPAPVIAGESVSGVTGTNATLEAQINPEGQNVHYQFQLVTNSSEYASELECPEPSSTICVGTHVQGALPIGLVWGNLENPLAAQPVSLDLAGAGVKLEPGTTYHYRVIAAPSVPSEDTIEWEGAPIYGPDQTFTTASAPSIESVSVSHITSVDATLEAQINTQAVADRGRHHPKHKCHHSSKVARHRCHRSNAAGHKHRKP
jgi:hypothetical protein